MIDRDPGLAVAAEVAAEQSEPDASLGVAATTSALWALVQRWFMRISGFVTIAVLARELSPEDFGTVTVATTVLPLIYLLSDMGFGAYVIQAKSENRVTLNTVYWYAVGSGVLLSGLLAVAAPVIADVLNAPSVTRVIQAFVPVTILVTAGTVPQILLQRRMQFRLLAVQSVVAGVVSQMLAVTLAFSGLGVWALVWQSLSYQVVTVSFAWAAARWRPSFVFSFTEFRTVARFGSNVVGSQLAALARFWAENALFVAVLGVTGLGYLNMAQRLVTTAQDLTASAVLPVSTVVFARVRGSLARLRSAYLRALGVTYVAVAPVLVGVAIGAPVLVPLLFGPGWETSVLPTQALAVAGIMVIGATLDQSLFFGGGQPGRWFVYSVIIDGLTVAVTAVLVRYGLAATSAGFVGVALVATIARWSLVGRLLEMTWTQSAAPFLKVCVAAVPSAVAGWGVVQVSGSVAPLLLLVAMAAVILAVHFAVVRLVMRDEYAEARRLTRKVAARIPLGVRSDRAAVMP